MATTIIPLPRMSGSSPARCASRAMHEVDRGQTDGIADPVPADRSAGRAGTRSAFGMKSSIRGSVAGGRRRQPNGRRRPRRRRLPILGRGERRVQLVAAHRRARRRSRAGLVRRRRLTPTRRSTSRPTSDRARRSGWRGARSRGAAGQPRGRDAPARAPPGLSRAARRPMTRRAQVPPVSDRIRRATDPPRRHRDERRRTPPRRPRDRPPRATGPDPVGEATAEEHLADPLTLAVDRDPAAILLAGAGSVETVGDDDELGRATARTRGCPSRAPVGLVETDPRGVGFRGDPEGRGRDGREVLDRCVLRRQPIVDAPADDQRWSRHGQDHSRRDARPAQRDARRARRSRRTATDAGRGPASRGRGGAAAAAAAAGRPAGTPCEAHVREGPVAQVGRRRVGTTVARTAPRRAAAGRARACTRGSRRDGRPRPPPSGVSPAISRSRPSGFDRRESRAPRVPLRDPSSSYPSSPDRRRHRCDPVSRARRAVAAAPAASVVFTVPSGHPSRSAISVCVRSSR